MKFATYIALVATAEARHHHHHRSELVNTASMSQLESMSTNRLVETLKVTLNSALAAEAKDDAASAVAKTAAIKNIQKALTARILKRLDDGQPLVEVARKMKAIEGMQP
jgi:SLT domain-containing protein